MHTKMMAYDRVITELNSHRIAGTPSSLIAGLSDAARASGDDVRFHLAFSWNNTSAASFRLLKLHTHTTY
jgi:hypothetical protein